MKRKTSKKKTAKWGKIGAPNSAKRKKFLKSVRAKAHKKTHRKRKR